MKPFHVWIMEPITPLNQRLALPEGLWEDKSGNLLAQCRACEHHYRYDGDPADGFDPDMSYCGRSDRCIP